MYIISVCSSEYLYSINQGFLHLVLYDCLLLRYFYCCITVLVVLLTGVVILLLSPKRNLYLNKHCVYVKFVHITSTFHIVAMFVTADITTIFPIHNI